jgi:methyltransferase (TIGR00027 family)
MHALHTAAAIAAVRADEATLPEAERLFEDPYARRFSGVPDAVQQVFAAMPFFREHVRLRTRFIDDFVRDGLAKNVRQIVLLGAGFDSRALRMPEIGQARALLVEVDLDVQLEEKAHGLGPEWQKAVRTVPADLASLELGTTLPAKLAEVGFDPQRPSLWLAEGLIGYLARDEVERVFGAASALSASGSRIVLTYHRTAWHENAVRGFLERAGFARVQEPSYAELHARFLAPPCSAESDWYRISTAERP